MYLKELDANLIVVLDALLIDASVTRAAERLGRSPSAVSHALSNLREILSDELFVRAGQRLVPTARAQAIAPTVHIIVSGLEGLLRPSTPFDPATQERRYTLACGDTSELTVLRAARARLAEHAPGIALDWQPLHPAGLVEDLREGALQFAIVSGLGPAEAADISAAPLREERYATFAATGSKPGGRHILIAGMASAMAEHSAAHDVAIGETMEASSALVALHLAIASGARVTLPEALVAALGPAAPVKPAPRSAPPLIVPLTLLWHRSQERDECHAWVRRQLLEAAAAG